LDQEAKPSAAHEKGVFFGTGRRETNKFHVTQDVSTKPDYLIEQVSIDGLWLHIFNKFVFIAYNIKCQCYQEISVRNQNAIGHLKLRGVVGSVGLHGAIDHRGHAAQALRYKLA
jgi:hypothetical protein